jgi:hypothetical protein
MGTTKEVSCVDEVQTLEYVAHNYTTKAEEPVGGDRRWWC